MKKSLKFWKWRLDLKTKRLDADEKIGYLANELIKQLKASGRSIAHPCINKGFGSVDISVYNLGTKYESLAVFDLINKWEIKTKPTFKEF